MLERLVDYIRNFFTPNRLSITLCILLATIGWFLTKMSKEYNHQLSFHILYQLPKDLSFSFNPPQKIDAEVRGKGWSLLRLAVSTIDDTITLDQTEVYDRTVSTRLLLSESLKSATNDELTIISAAPEQVEFQLVERQTRRVPVKLDGNLSLANQYQWKEPYWFEPDSINVYGAEDQLTTIDHWPTDPFERSGIDENFNITLPLYDASPALTTDTSTVSLVGMVDQVTEKEIYVPIEIPDSLKDQVRIFPGEVLVKITLGLSMYDQVDSEDFEVALEGDSTGSNQRKVVVRQIPDFVNYISHEPQYIDYYRSVSETPNPDE
ncbi:MAG: YbbR-like domain-containing protein [Saprospiraceae bacterium]|nr:YbbR-like domain-containing protein [Saprospiraceae bacterium]